MTTKRFKLKKLTLPLFTIALILIGVTTLLTGFAFSDNSEDSEDVITATTTMKELVFIEKTNKYAKPSVIFESSEDKRYYLVEIDNYLYDNLELEAGEVLELESKETGPMQFPGNLFFNALYGNEFSQPEEEIFIFDESRSLFIATKYMKEAE